MVKELKILGRQLFSWGEPNVASKIERSMPGTMGGVSGYKAAAVSPVVFSFRRMAVREGTALFPGRNSPVAEG